MLEIKNLTKTYHAKNGVSVKALDNVSIAFPKTGMVFVLGKSGSGKSTLLNVIGGLDASDSGEFIIKGKSSKQFGGSDFDAYRNTFIGFIFQEYNILDDFSVGANIGLALELQGKKATNEQITNILAQVDLLEFAKRKPNELSGGQKQRVAIARALVKDPEIIMADEPTGALDSNTGKQIFDTLKELSKTKLVIVVSHDRDFAERYADRIIEMKDGQILSDVTKRDVESEKLSHGIVKVNDSVLKIQKGYQLTATDLELINRYLREQSADILISGDERVNDNVRTAAGISMNDGMSVFEKTDEAKDVIREQYDGRKTKFIRSRLPTKNAVKMGSNSLGHKKFRLVSTIALSLVAFLLFGFADTLGAYNKYTTATQSILDSNVQNATFTVEVKRTWSYPDGDSHSYYSSACINDNDIKVLSQKTGLEFIPVYDGSDGAGGMFHGNSISFAALMAQNRDKIGSSTAYTGSLGGFSVVEREKLEGLGYRIIGDMPSAEDEIAITELIYRQLNFTGFKNDDFEEQVSAGELTMVDDGSKNSIIGKHLTVAMHGISISYKITGVIDTGFDYDRYAKYVPNEDTIDGEMGNELVDMIMMAELANTVKYGFHSLGYITESAMNTITSKFPIYNESFIGQSMNNWSVELIGSDANMPLSWLNRIGTSNDMSLVGNIEWFDGRSDGALGKNEMLVSKNIVNNLNINVSTDKKVKDSLKKICGDSIVNDENYKNSIEEMLRHAAVENYLSNKDEFARIRADVLEAYNRENGYYKPGFDDPNYSDKFEGSNNYYPQPTDEELKNYVRERLLYSGYESLPASVARMTDLLKNIYRSFYEEVFGIETSELLPYEFYQMTMWQCFMTNENGEYFLAPYNARSLLVNAYAYNSLYADPTLLTNDQFFKEVISQNTWLVENWDDYDDDAKLREAAVAYAEYILYRTEKNSFGDKSVADFDGEVMAVIESVSGFRMSDLLKDAYIKVQMYGQTGEVEKIYDYNIVGTFDGDSSDLVICEELAAEYEKYCEDNNIGKETVAYHEKGIYSFVIAPMPTDPDEIRELVNITYSDGDVVYKLQNQVMDTLNSFNDFIEMGAKIFIYIGLGFALFAALMMMNFISVSISYKRREIGILRAVGARSSDVFKIFFSEAFIIALINYVLSLAATITAVTVFNTIVRNEGINVTLLNFGIRQIVLMFAISLFVAAISSFLPVWNIARRKPIDAIKNK